jgi:hypothetical protein
MERALRRFPIGSKKYLRLEIGTFSYVTFATRPIAAEGWTGKRIPTSWSQQSTAQVGS